MTFNSYLEDVFIVIPAKDEARFIHRVLQTAVGLGFRNIVIVNDNSSDDTKNIGLAFGDAVKVLDHVINLGPGAATKTGIDYALSQGANFIATIDADYQHNPKDLIPLIKCIKSQNLDLVIGSRFMKRNSIPISRVMMNFFGNLVNYFISGLVITDSQSGMKVMSRRFAENLEITYNGFEFCIEIIKNASITKSNVYEYPIDVSYSKETMAKGQSFGSGVSMLGRLFNPFR